MASFFLLLLPLRQHVTLSFYIHNFLVISQNKMSLLKQLSRYIMKSVFVALMTL